MVQFHKVFQWIPYLAPMVATQGEIQAMDAFFKAKQLDKVFKLNQAITITDLPRFVQRILEGLLSGNMADAVARPRWDDLVRIKKILERQEKE